MAPCSGAAGRAGLCQGAPLGVLVPPRRWSIAGSTSPVATGAAALLAPPLPAPQASLLAGTLAMGVPWGRPGWGAEAGCDAQIPSARCLSPAGRQPADLPFPSRSFQPCRQGMGDGEQWLFSPPRTLTPAIVFQEKNPLLSWLSVKHQLFVETQPLCMPGLPRLPGRCPPSPHTETARAQRMFALSCYITTLESPVLAFPCPHSTG